MIYLFSVERFNVDNIYETFTGLIYGIYKEIQKIKNAEMEKVGLKGKQVQCFFHLYKNPDGLSLKQLCDLTGADKAAISRTIKELETLSYVHTSKSANKKYGNPVKLTEKGLETGNYIDGIINEMAFNAGKGLPEQDRKVLYDALELINLNLNEICKKYGD